MRNDEVVRLFDLYANDLYRFALSYLGSKQDAEDTVQDIYLKLLSKSLLLRKDREKDYFGHFFEKSFKNPSVVHCGVQPGTIFAVFCRSEGNYQGLFTGML